MAARRPLPLALEVRDLRLVDAVAVHGTLTRAGVRLHLTQSALSHQLAALEARLGAPIFSRVGRRMVLTPAGERLRDSARGILAALARAEDDLREAAANREGVIRLGTECYTCYHWLPPVLTQFRRQFPRVETRIVAGMTRRPVPALLKGQLDLAIVSSKVHDRRLQLTPLFEDELVAVFAPDHPWASRRFVVAEDFAGQHLIALVPPAESTLFQRVLHPAGVHPHEVSEVQLTEAVVEIVKAGIGVGVLARWAIAPQLKSGALQAVPITERGVRRTWSAAVRTYKAMPDYIAPFVSILARNAFPAGATSGARRRTA